MLINTQILTIATLFSTLVTSRPLDVAKPRNLIPRSRSYAIINVDGGSSTEAPAQATTIVKETKTVEVVNPGPTVTQEVTSVVVQPVPAPAVTSSSSKSTSRSTSSLSSSTSTSLSSSTSTSVSTPTISSSSAVSISTSIETPKPIIVTVTAPENSGPSDFYDNGMWHTLYRIKTFEAVVATSTVPTSSLVTSSSTILPVLETPVLSYNQTTS
ncbi:Nn.00g087200.m01.CDS01 [Neocucurbitaria sp. VM-36]